MGGHHKTLKIFTVVVVALVGLVSGKVYATAESGAWLNANIDIREADVSDFSRMNCQVSDISVRDITDSGTPVAQSYKACLYIGKNLQIAKYREQSSYKWAAKKQTDPWFVRVGNVGIDQDIRVSTNSDRITYFDKLNNGSLPAALTSTENGLDSIVAEARDTNGEVLRYNFEPVNRKVWFDYFDGARDVNAAVVDYVYSTNGRFMMAWVEYRGYVLVDFETASAKAIFSAQSSWLGGPNRDSGFGLLSSDGKTFIIGASANMIETENCGQAYTKQLIESGRDFQDSSLLCKERVVKDFPSILGFSGKGSQYRWVQDSSFEFLYRSYSPVAGAYIIKNITITNPISDMYKLDYLALGDSYSSGEGDTGRQSNGLSFYLPSTSSPSGCHVSSRSYPFLLARLNNIQPERVRNIACSGARISKDYSGSSQDYLGQSERLKGMTEPEKLASRTTALKEFTPGILKQIEFVKENKPKTVTLSGGGNDVGFVDVLKACIYAMGGTRSSTCDQAVQNTKARSMLGDAIYGQYDYMVRMVSAIKEASSATTIYVVGYPSFVSESSATCINSALLNQAERKTINEAVVYMNVVMKQAAAAAGAHYLDIENSLKGGRMCEGSEYMTGPLNIVGSDMLDRKNEMFHPNSLGQQKMATAASTTFKVEANANPLAQSGTAPGKPATFGTAAYVPTWQEKILEDGAIYLRRTLKLAVSPLYFAAGEPISLTIWSKPESLGKFTTGSDGSLSATVKLPNSIEPGYHMVMVEGKSKDGKLLRLYQFIEVQSDKQNDRDGDGIKDDKDACLYIERWYDEATGKNICKSTSHGQPGSGNGNGGGSGNGDGPVKYDWLFAKLFKYWKANAYHAYLGAIFCLGVLGLRLR